MGASLRNSQKLVLQTTWNWEFFDNMIEGFKSRIPAMTDAVLKFINKYHTSHFGFNLNRGGVKLRNAISNMVEKAYGEIPAIVTTTQDLVQTLSDQGKDIYRKVLDGLMSLNVDDAGHQLVREVRVAFRHTRDRIRHLLEAVAEFFSKTKFTVPGSESMLSIVEMFQKAGQSSSRVFDGAVQLFSSFLENIYELIRSSEFTVPGVDIIVNGGEIMDKMEAFIEATFKHMKNSINQVFSLFQKTVNEVFKIMAETLEVFLAYLKDHNEEITYQVDALYAEMLQSSKQHTDEVKIRLAEFKDLLELNIQEAYSMVSVNEVNDRTRELISLLQSNLSEALSESVDQIQKASQSTAPYVRVSKEKVDIEIPLPFLWRSFNEWPFQIR